MADTIRTWAFLQNVLRDGQTPGSIIPQNVRDFLATVLSATVGVSAGGATQGNATPLSAITNVVTTVAAGSGIILTAGVHMIILNRGANGLAVYPPSTGKIEALGTNLPYIIPPGQDGRFWFDPANPNNAYASLSLNLASLPTSEPASSGVIWNNGGVVSIS